MKLALLAWLGWLARMHLLAFLAALTGAVILTLLVVLDEVPNEVPVTLDVQDSGVPGQTISDAVRTITTTEIVIVVGAVTAAAHWLRRDRAGALVLVALLALLVVSQAGIKELVDRPRPTMEEVRILATGDSSSFPAGHVMSPTVGYGWFVVAAYVLRLGTPAQRLAFGAFVAAFLLLAGLANVYVGAHWPTDVLGGYLWGLTLLLLAIAVYVVMRSRIQRALLSLLHKP